MAPMINLISKIFNHSPLTLVKWTARLEFKLADMWIGLFYRKSIQIAQYRARRYHLDAWICLLPCVPLHITLTYADPWKLNVTERALHLAIQRKNEGSLVDAEIDRLAAELEKN